MAKTIKEERLRWVLPLIKKEARLVDTVKVCHMASGAWNDGWPLTETMAKRLLNQNQQNQKLSRMKHQYELRNE